MSECMCSVRRPFRRHQSCCHTVDHKSGVTAVSVCTIHLWQMCQLAEHSRGNCYGAGRGGGERERGSEGEGEGGKRSSNRDKTSNTLSQQGQGSWMVLEERSQGCCVVMPIKQQPVALPTQEAPNHQHYDAIELAHKVVPLVEQWREGHSWACPRPWLEVLQTWEKVQQPQHQPSC